jgi:hypothetical protein
MTGAKLAPRAVRSIGWPDKVTFGGADSPAPAPTANAARVNAQSNAVAGARNSKFVFIFGCLFCL